MRDLGEPGWIGWPHLRAVRGGLYLFVGDDEKPCSRAYWVWNSTSHLLTGIWASSTIGGEGRELYLLAPFSSCLLLIKSPPKAWPPTSPLPTHTLGFVIWLLQTATEQTECMPTAWRFTWVQVQGSTIILRVKLGHHPLTVSDEARWY